MKLFSVYDSKAEMYSAPFVERTHETARRSFLAAVRDDKSAVGQYPHDYALFVIGSFDDTSGVITPAKAPTMVWSGTEALQELNKLINFPDTDEELARQEIR